MSIIAGDLKGDAERIRSQIRDLTEGFALVLAGLKAYLEYNIHLHLIADRFPGGAGFIAD